VPKKIHRRREADPKEGVRKYGKATFADPVNNKYPIDTPGRIKAAWAYIHQPVNAGKYSNEKCGPSRSGFSEQRRLARGTQPAQEEVPPPKVS